MNITLTKKQYETIIRSLELANNIYGLMNDSFDDEHCKEQYKAVEETESTLLSHHKDFWIENVEYDTEKDLYSLNDDYTMSIYDDIHEFSELQFLDSLTLHLARQDIQKTMPELVPDEDDWYDDDYGQALSEHQDKYFHLIEKHGLEALQFITK